MQAHVQHVGTTGKGHSTTVFYIVMYPAMVVSKSLQSAAAVDLCTAIAGLQLVGQGTSIRVTGKIAYSQ